MADDRDRVFREISAKGTREFGLVGPECLANTGSAASRLAVPVMINVVAMAGGTTASMATIVAETYKEIRIISRTTGGITGGSPAFIRFNGDTGANYDATSFYAFGGGTSAVNAVMTATSGQLALIGGGTSPDLTMLVDVLPLVASSMNRPFYCRFNAHGSTVAGFITGTSNGYWNNTASGLTDIQITFGVAATGSVEFWGVPA